MCAIGGAWFPVTLMPEFIQQVSKLTLVYWAMEGFSQVLWANASFLELLPPLGILGLSTAVVMAVAVWRFNRGKIFGGRLIRGRRGRRRHWSGRFALANGAGGTG